MAYDPMDALDPEAKPAKPIKQPKPTKSRDPMDALDMPDDNRQGFADQPGPVMAEWYEDPPDTSDRPKYLGDLPHQTLGRIETNPETQRKEYVEGPGTIRAEFTDQPSTGTVSAQGLARAHKDTMRLGRQALMGGALQGATFGFADELAASGAKDNAEYRKTRDETRRAFAEAEQGDPSAFATGELAGGAATMAIPGLGELGQLSKVNYAAEVARLMRAGKTAREAGEMARVSLLSPRGVAVGTGYGALQAAGSSNADLTEGEYGKFGIDVAKGGAAGAATTTVLGAAGKGISKAKTWLATAPERQTTRADDALWQLITRGADKAKREELAGVLGSDRGDVLAMARSNSAFMEALKKGDKTAAADMVLSAQPEVLARREAAIASSEAKTPGARAVVGKPIIAEMEKRRDALRATPTPENMSAADKWQKRIDALNAAWMPAVKAPELKGEALASRLTANADRGTVERAAKYAPDFGKVAEKYKLGKGVDDVAARQEKIGTALESLNKKTEEIYDRPMLTNDSDRMEPIRLFRAADDDYIQQGTSFSEDIDAARAYIDNPGFGGRNVYHTVIAPLEREVLDLRGMSAKEAASRLGMKNPGAIGVDEWLPRTPSAFDKARELGYKWAIVDESYPVQSTTWQYLGKITDEEPNLFRVTSKTNLSAKPRIPRGGRDSVKADVYVANVTGKLREWADELRQATGGAGADDAVAVDKVRAQFSQWAQEAGTEATGSKTTMTAKELRQYITNTQGKAFAGSYLDPNDAKAMQRKLVGKLREVLDAHVAEHGRPSDVKKLAELNKEISALIAFQESGEREAVEAFKGLHKATPAVAAPDTRNGRARVEQLYKLIQSTDDPEAKRVLTGELYRQIGPEATKRLTGIEREESLLERLGTVTKAGAEQKAGDSERGKRLGHLFDRHNPISSVVAKYGDAIADKANAFAVRAENLRRRGASNSTIRTLGKAMGMGAEVVEDIIRVVAPKGAGAQAVGK